MAVDAESGTAVVNCRTKAGFTLYAVKDTGNAKPVIQSDFYLGFPTIVNNKTFAVVSEEVSAHDNGYGQVVIINKQGEGAKPLTEGTVEIKQLAVYDETKFAFAYFGLSPGLNIRYESEGGKVVSKNLSDVHAISFQWIKDGEVLRILHREGSLLITSDFSLSSKKLTRVATDEVGSGTYLQTLDNTGKFAIG